MTDRSLGENAGWNLVGIVVHTASQWAILIVLAKGGTPTMVGQVALGLAIATPIFLVLNLGLRQVLATDAKQEYASPLYLRIRLTTTAIGLLVTVLVSLLFSAGSTTLHVVWLVGLAKGLDAVSELCYGLFQRIERLDYVGRSLVLRGVGSVALVAWALARTGNVEIAVGSWVLVWAATLILHDAPLFFRNADPRFADAPGSGWSLVRFSLPLGVTGMLVALSLNMPRYFLAHHHGEAALGLFAAVAFIPMSGRRVLEAIGQATTPRLARLWAERQRAAFRRLLGRLILLGTACLIVGVSVAALLGKPILAFVYAEEYASQSGILLWLMASWGLRYPSAFLISGVIATRRFRVVPWVFLPSLIAAFVGGVLWVPKHGIQGAAWADMFSVIVQVVLTLFLAYGLISARASE